MKTFIRVAEIWVPTADRTALEFGGGLYGPLSAFKAVSEATRFALDEGLPGKAWASRHPIMLKDLQHSYFKRGAEASAAGLTCGVALPIFAGANITAVVVFLCGSDEDHVGAIELWTNDPEVTYQIGLADGYYGSAELMEWKSRSTSFGRGFGLPGMVWQSGMPLIMTELFRPRQFLRWDQAQQIGMTTGLGIPCPYDPRCTWVMTFLSALGTPIARRFEVWVPGKSADTIAFEAGTFEKSPKLLSLYEGMTLDVGEGIIGKTFETAAPAIIENMDGEPAKLKAALDVERLTSAVAIPILAADGRPRAVVAWYF